MIDSRTQLTAELAALGFEVLPSVANFVFARHPQHDAAQLAAGLRARSVIVRHFNAPRISQYLRISIGNPTECAALLDALRTLV